jgi:cyanophycin synthetase
VIRAGIEPSVPSGRAARPEVQEPGRLSHRLGLHPHCKTDRFKIKRHLGKLVHGRIPHSRPARPQLWSRHTAIEAIVSCPEPSASSTTCPVSNCACAPASQIGFLEPDGGKQVVSMAHALAAPPWPAGAGRLPGHLQPHRATVETGIYQVVVEYSEEEVGRLAFDLALELCRPRWPTPFDLTAALAASASWTKTCAWAPPPAPSSCRRGARHSLPPPDPGQPGAVRLGQPQRRIQAAETSTTSAMAESIAQDKDLTKMLLHAAGVPVPNGRWSDVEDAKAAEEIGLPVVVKPQDGNQGKGVAVNIAPRNRSPAPSTTPPISDDVMVERYLPGHDFRLLVIGQAGGRRPPRPAAGHRRRRAHHRQLVDQVNADPRAATATPPR